MSHTCRQALSSSFTTVINVPVLIHIIFKSCDILFPGVPAVGAKDDPSGRRASTLRGGGRLPPMKGKKKGKAKYEVRTPLIELQAELHQIVGTFSTFSERAPAAIDTGMFDWSEMKAFGAPPPPVVAVEEVEERTEERAPEEMTAFQMTAIEKQRKTVPVWKSYSLSPGSGEVHPSLCICGYHMTRIFHLHLAYLRVACLLVCLFVCFLCV